MAIPSNLTAKLSTLLPLDDESTKELSTYLEKLSDPEAGEHLQGLLGDSPDAREFVSAYLAHRQTPLAADMKSLNIGRDSKSSRDSKNGGGARTLDHPPPAFAPPAYPPPTSQGSRTISHRPHTNPVIEAGRVRAQDEQQMQNLLQSLQMQYQIYNSEIEPEHDADYYCSCPIHRYQIAKYNRLAVQDMWAKAVMYPGEKAYNDCNYRNTGIFSSNPYRFRVVSPYGYRSGWYQVQRPLPNYHAKMIHQTIDLNNQLNREAQASIDAKEPKRSIWHDDKPAHGDEADKNVLEKGPPALGADKKTIQKGNNDDESIVINPPLAGKPGKSGKSSKFASFRKSLGVKTTEERAVSRNEKDENNSRDLRNAILYEEQGRWPDEQWRQIVAAYQEKVGMTAKIADLRRRSPIQYLHLLRAGYFEPIPVAWAGSASNPLKFSIEAAGGWRGITPAWRGYEDTAEERLYWVLNHREGSTGTRLKPDFISALNMALARMASAVPPPPEYYSATDICHVQHTSKGYSNQVMPAPLLAYDRPELPTDDTMILLDVSGSMDFDPFRPVYNQYLITGYAKSTQPKNKDVAKAIIRRFTDAMSNHDRNFQGYDLTTFSSFASYIGTVNHQNLEQMWRKIRIGGGTRVMTGWQKVKDLHFQKHAASATHHPVYGWQAGPDTPMLRLLLLLDGEATDMDEFELDLLGLSWAHVTIFLVGSEGCVHHHRHANELQRISDVNHHVSFVDAAGNTPERFVTHELLKRHLGYELSIAEFTELEAPPAYSE